jgi:pilus assembly protein CpaC
MKKFFNGMKKDKIKKLTISFLFFLIAIQHSVLAQNQNKSKKNKDIISEKSESSAYQEEVLLIVGLQKTYDLKFEPCTVGGSYEECMKVANPSLVKVQFEPQRKQLVFTPLKKGETTLTLRNEDGDIALKLNMVISESNLTRRVQELKDLLRDIEGIEIKVVADKIVIDGEVIVVSDLNRLYAVISDSAYKDLVLNLVTVSPIGYQMIAQKMQQEINNPNVKVRVLNGYFILEGQVESEAQARQAEAVARGLLQGYTLPTYNLQGPNTPIEIIQNKPGKSGPIINRLAIAPKKPKPPEKMVRITVDFVELSKDYLRNFGFNWSPSLSGDGGSIGFGMSSTGGMTSTSNGALSGTISNLFPKLQTAQNAGYARILEETVVIVKNNKEAAVNRTTTIPFVFQAVAPNGAPTNTTKDFSVGADLKIKPIIENETITLDIGYSYSSALGQSPAGVTTLNNNFKTVAIVRNNESAALVNVIQNTASTTFNKNPPGGESANPIFTLLRSKAFQKNKSQFVVFITPQIIDSASDSTEDIKKRYGYNRNLANDSAAKSNAETNQPTN